jgi:hypothetical protein
MIERERASGGVAYAMGSLADRLSSDCSHRTMSHRLHLASTLT